MHSFVYWCHIVKVFIAVKRNYLSVAITFRFLLVILAPFWILGQLVIRIFIVPPVVRCVASLKIWELACLTPPTGPLWWRKRLIVIWNFTVHFPVFMTTFDESAGTRVRVDAKVYEVATAKCKALLQNGNAIATRGQFIQSISLYGIRNQAKCRRTCPNEHNVSACQPGSFRLFCNHVL